MFTDHYASLYADMIHYNDDQKDTKACMTCRESRHDFKEKLIERIHQQKDNKLKTEEGKKTFRSSNPVKSAQETMEWFQRIKKQGIMPKFNFYKCKFDNYKPIDQKPIHVDDPKDMDAAAKMAAAQKDAHRFTDKNYEMILDNIDLEAKGILV